MPPRRKEYFPKYRLTNTWTGEYWEARGLRPVLKLAGLSIKTPSVQIHKSNKWVLEEIEPPLEWDQQTYRRELYKRTKDRYPLYEAKKLAQDPLYQRRKQTKLHNWINLDGTKFTAEQHEHMLEQPCKICGATHDTVVDHCHTTKVVRGPLCRKCNLALGHVDDNVDKLYKMIDYLIQYTSQENNFDN